MEGFQAVLVGIDPSREVKREIQKLKNVIRESVGYQLQINEPPHMTFVVNNFNNIQEVERRIDNIAKNFPPFEINIKRIKYFDPKKSSSKYIIYAEVEKSRFLSDLQKRILVETAPYRRGCLLKDFLEKNLSCYRYDSSELRNIDLYGYPYAGTNWNPHLTVAILENEAFKKIRKQIIKDHLGFCFLCREITMFSYSEKWHPYKKFALGNLEE